MANRHTTMVKRQQTNGSSTKRTRTSTSRKYPSRPGKRVVSVPRPLASTPGTAFPHRYQNELRYSAVQSIVLDPSGWGKHFFSCNGLYDPDITGLGHQPLYYDQLTALYNHYTVIKSSITIQPMGFEDNSYVLSLSLEDDTSSSFGNTTREQPDTKSWVVSAPQGDKDNKHSLYWNAAKVFGGDIIDNDDLQGTLNTNPPEQTFYMLGMEGVAATVHSYFVELRYTVVWDELKTVAGS